MDRPGALSSILTRRTLLLGAAAFLSPSRAVPDTLIIRPEIKGVHPRYAAYASVGEYALPKAPVSFRTPRSKIVVFYPMGVEKARLVVFSHGALSDPMTYGGLLQHWASHGFVVAAPLHEDAAIEHGLKLRRSQAAGVSEWQIPKLLDDEKAWRTRTDACSACLDAIPLISDATGVRITDERPVIAGHGYGAFVAQVLMGARVKSSEGAELDYRDPRFFSGILMSPQGAGVMGLNKDSWSRMPNPLLTVLATNDRDFTGQSAEARSDPFRLSTPGYKHLAVLEGGNSNSFAGQAAGSLPEEARRFEALKALTTAFMKAYSSYEQEAFDDMGADFFLRMSLGAVKEERR